MESQERYQQAKRLFAAALELPVAERRSFLERECDGDRALLDEVEALLGQHQIELSGESRLAINRETVIQLLDPTAVAAAGDRIGPYEVGEKLGEGGMGVVYRARDAVLNRDVALKVISAALASDPERLARFRREAQVLASLNHPNIAHLYGFVETPADARGASSVRALVMELVDGPTLAERLEGGPLPLDECLVIARQVIDALEAAHEQGFVHRDLKPTNIKVREDGTVKVLDFGLAKAVDPTRSGAGGASGSGERAARTPTPFETATAHGTILGTAAYMSPEQAKGRPADRRSDIWSFGVILVEMLSGRRPFRGEGISDTLASVLRDEVDWQSLPGDLPESIRRLLRRCLERDPKRRLSAIGDARLDLDEATSAMAAPHAASASRSKWFWVATAAVVLFGIAAVAQRWIARPAPSAAPRMEFLVTTPERSTTDSSAPAMSPDGSMLAFVGLASGPSSQDVIWIRPLSSLTARSVPGTEGAVAAFWSPDSTSLAFFANGKLNRIDLAGDRTQQICDLQIPYFFFLGGAWNSDGVMLVAISQRGLIRVPAAGGAPSDVIALGKENTEALYAPSFLPDGTHFLYTVRSADSNRRGVYSGSLDGTPPVRLMDVESPAVYVEPGLLLFVRDGKMLAQPFDARRRQVSGEPSVVLNNARSDFSSSRNGAIAFRAARSFVPKDLVWFDRNGKELQIAGTPGYYRQLRLSPDEKRVVLNVLDPAAMTTGLAVLDLTSQVISRLTAPDRMVDDAVWSPDGQRLLFGGSKKGHKNFFQQEVGSAVETTFFASPEPTKYLDDWTSDGRYVLFHQPTRSQLFALPLFGDRQPILLADGLRDSDQARVSPDGKWVVYQTRDSGTYQVWVAAFPSFDRRRQISLRGGGAPFWRGDGGEVLFITADAKMMSVMLQEDARHGDIVAQPPTELFQSPLSDPSLVVDEYAVTRDGQRFLFLRKRDKSASAGEIAIVVNWASTDKSR